MRATSLLTVLLTWAIACLPALAAPTYGGEPVQYDLKIESQPLGKALQEFAEQSGVQVIFFSKVTEGREAPAIRGKYTAAAALGVLLNDSHLTFRELNPKTIEIRPTASTMLGTSRDEASPETTTAQALGESEISDSGTTKNTGWFERFRLAQNEPSSPSDSSSSLDEKPSESSSKNSDQQKLEEVIVTATKRAENIRDVPLSITAITAEEIERRGLVNAGDYLRGIPGTNQTEAQAGGQAIVIRGIETTTVYQNLLSGPTIATYFGETPTTNSGGLYASNIDIKLVDIERVEVLRGPQGTAFGNSSLGGAVRQIPVAPKLDHLEGKVAAGFSVTSRTGGNNHNVEAVGNIPLIKGKFAIRAVAYQYQDSGFYRNRAGSDAAYQTTFVVPFGAQAFATDENNVGAYYVAGGRVAALFQASDDLRFTLSYLKQKSQTNGWALQNSGRFEQTFLGVAPEHVRRGQAGGSDDFDIGITNAVTEYDLGWGDLLATYSHVKGEWASPITWTVFDLLYPVSQPRFADNREDSGEVRLATKLDGDWNFLAGLYAERQHDNYDSPDSIWLGDLAANFFAPGERNLGQYHERRNLTQKAVFGEISWEFLPRFTLKAGGRAYKYERTIETTSNGPVYGDADTRDETASSGGIYRTNLSYKPDDNAVIYASWSQGFRLGRPQFPVPVGLCDTNNDGIIDGTNFPIRGGGIAPDTVDGYELGGKFTALNRRLAIDAAIFRIDWSKLPALQAIPCGDGIYANVGEARSEGVELQARFQITGPFRVDLGGSWIKARLTEDVPAQGYEAGDRLPGAPKVNANLGLQYEFAISDHPAFVRLDAIYIGSFYGDVLESPTLKTEAYAKLDASARVTIDNINIDFFVRNLTNEDSIISRSAYNYVGELYGYRLRPRTTGLQLSYNF